MEEEEEDAGGGEGWLVSFADLMTLLFAAFVVLYGSLEVGTSDRILGYTAAIRESFVEVPDFVEKDQEIGEIKKGEFVFKAYYGEASSKGAKRYLIKEDPKVAIDRDKSHVDKLLDQIAMTSDGIDFGLRNSMNTVPGERGFTIQLMGAYFFESGTYRFSRQGRERFIRLGKLLNQLSRKLLIEGHTDNVKSNGEFDNHTLGSLRAANASRILTREIGMSPNLIDTISYGDQRPIAPNDTDANRRKNRRIEIKVLTAD
ncbi:OmpA family protein [Pseudobacteriovorax antillogorgiicola]|uniref:Chemotaxis protein MotB n=1 Tax=Pseudobacteriovorax antillogorgiicola TaxID=1513793 RepID=A0A1Y6C7A0_9BACT|nr:OmpA family protein [Pseudobacteriovorax antillogorgiicola]TCS49421.1 chemotaxis protein MotB [Pseudobacteriovorax antillogorgiicola]SMF46850.1 chemotaxis protein MotB [Pseudobacteriovorax antillogorgiicola]